MSEGISLIIPTRNGGELFKECLRAVRNQHYDHNLQLIVIDSGSSDGTILAAENAGARVIRIKKEDFHHSRTRNEALKYAIHPRVVFIVQDAVPISSDWLNIMSNALERDDVAAAYGRQLPHENAGLFAWFETTSHSEFLGDRVLVQALDSKESLKRMPYELAVRLTRCDNVCAIYKREELSEVPFPDLIFGEDMAWAKKVLLRGRKIRYDPAIQIRHSHNRPPDYRFRRALVGNIISAGILERVREDLSFLTCRDLDWAEELLRLKQERIVDLFRLGATRDQMMPASFLSKLYRIPRVKNALALLYGRIGLLFGRRQWRFSFPRIFEAHLGFVLNKVGQAFPLATDRELLSCAEQVLAVIRGNLFGGVAASYRLRGELPAELDARIQHCLEGV